jgi:hypothetical protein
MSCKYCDGSGIGFGDNSKDMCVFENNGNPELVIPLNSNGSVSINVDFCPKCGRNLREDSDQHEHLIKIPVPLGAKVWTFWTDCCHACYLQNKDNRPDEVRCSRESACHTLKHSIQCKILTFSNLETVLDGWGVFYFKTSKEAEEAGNKRIQENIKRMRALGYGIDDNGYLIKQNKWDAIDD